MTGVEHLGLHTLFWWIQDRDHNEMRMPPVARLSARKPNRPLAARRRVPWRAKPGWIRGWGLLAIGAILGVSPHLFNPPDWASTLYEQPWIVVWADQPLRPVTVTASLGIDGAHAFAINGGSVSPSELVAPIEPSQKSGTLWLYVESRVPMTWEVTAPNTRAVSVSRDGDTSVTKPLGRASGNDRQIGFQVDLSDDQPMGGFKIKSSGEQVFRSGPYVRHAYPWIDSAQGSAASQSGNLTSKELLRDDIEAGTIDGQPAYAPHLYVWATGIDETKKHADYLPLQLSPNPEYTPPYGWFAQGRFFADVLYRDTRVDRWFGMMTFLAGLAVAFGTGELLREPRAATGADTPTGTNVGRSSSHSRRAKKR